MENMSGYTAVDDDLFLHKEIEGNINLSQIYLNKYRCPIQIILIISLIHLNHVIVSLGV